MTDPIADLLTRIRNAGAARHQHVDIPASQLKEAVVKILKDEGFVSHYLIEEQKPQSVLKVFLKYDAKKKSVIRHLARVSKPGGRIYKGYREIKPYLRGLGLTILSTPKGILTDRQARDQKVGGEVLCEVC